MSIFCNGEKAKNIYIGGEKVKTGHIDDGKIYSNEPVSSESVPGLYILWSNGNGGQPAQIWTNNNGNRGTLVETIATNNWTRLSQYAPEIERVDGNQVVKDWSNAGNIELNFAKLKEVRGYMFLVSDNTNYNPIVSFPMLWRCGAGFFAGRHNFNRSLRYPELTTIEAFGWRNGGEWMRYLSVFTSNVIFDKLVITTANSVEFMNFASSFTVEFRAVQNITTLNTLFLGNSTNKHLRIRSGSAAVNVANRTWAGRTFSSIILIDEHGNAV